MKSLILVFASLCMLLTMSAQNNDSYLYDLSAENPYGLPNPDAPKEILDWAELIGTCDCISESRNPDQTWAEPTKMVWRWKYIMNGWGVQDETLHETGSHSGSIRQFIPDSNHWYVHYYSSTGPTPVLSAWEGNRSGDSIILYRDQTAPNGMEGWYKINFKNISEDGFDWLGEWVNKGETFSYPTWKISCKKRKEYNAEEARETIVRNSKNFSQSYMNGDHKAMANTYTKDGKIMPGGRKIMEGYEVLDKYWTLPEGTKILNHEAIPEEIHVFGNYAYDYGYYYGKSQNKDQPVSEWKGKYVIIWKKEDGDWKMFLDIWNRVNE